MEVDGLVQIPAADPQELLEILRKGLHQRVVAEHVPFVGLGEDLGGVLGCFVGKESGMILSFYRVWDWLERRTLPTVVGIQFLLQSGEMEITDLNM